MESSRTIKPDLSQLKTPCFVIDKARLRENAKILQDVQQKSGAKILLALKAFAGFAFFDQMRRYLAGTAASGLHEARLGREEFGGEVHTYSPAYNRADAAFLAEISDHIVFNSISQYEKHSETMIKSKQKQDGDLKLGLRINTGVSTADTAIYDPCSPFSRLGIPVDQLPGHLPENITGLHFHTLCEQGFDALEKNLDALEGKIPHLLKEAKWINLGGGHHITREDYDREGLIKRLINLREKYELEVYMEPGEAAVIGTGIFVTTVMDTIFNGMNIGILDCSVPTHLPDVLEMPYRPEIRTAGEPGTKNSDWRLGGVSCLAGDVLGNYSFDHELQPGEKLILEDMTHYTMVKTTTFNGVPLPSIYSFDSENGRLELVKEFTYNDFKSRLS
jgi:carboxynorspermidine decarboxylase